MAGHAVDAHEQPRPATLELHGIAAGGRQLAARVEPVEHPADRRRALARPLRVDRAGDDQPVDRARHRDVVEAQALGLFLALARGAHLVVAARPAALACRRMCDLEAEPPVREREDLVGRGRLAIAPRVGDDDDLELESLCGMDRQQPDRVAAFLLGNGFELARPHRLLLGDEADEALDVRAAQLLVGTCETRELAQVRVAAAAVPVREHREVVVVLGDDPLAEQFQRELRREHGEPVEALLKRAQQAGIPLGERRRERLLETREDRSPTRGPTDQHERVVRHADERRGEHRQERLVVVAVVQQPQVREQVDDLLLSEVPAPGRAVRPEPRLAQLLLVPLRVGAGREEEHDLAGLRVSVVDQLLHALRDVLRLGTPPVHVGAGVRRLVRDEQLGRRAEDRVREVAGRVERLELLAELAREELVHDGEHLGPRPVVLRQRQDLRRGSPPLAEDLTSAWRKP